jgi:hypothetical protein
MPLWKDRQAFNREWGTREALDRISIEELYHMFGAHPGRIGVRFLVITGPTGCGSSAIARRTALVLSNPPWAGLPRVRPKLLRADLRRASTDHTPLVQLFRHFDPSFRGAGYSAPHLAALLRRRLSVQEGPVLLWFDNLRGAPPLPVLWDLLEHAADFLPSGSTIILSGTYDPTIGWSGPGEGLHRLSLKAAAGSELLDILGQVSREAFAEPLEDNVIQLIATRALSAGVGLQGAIDMLRDAGVRAEGRGLSRVGPGEVGEPADIDGRRDPRRVVSAILKSFERPAATLEIGVLQRRVCEWLGGDGHRPPSRSLVRRHVRRLERSGILSRAVTIGGKGGSRSMVSLRSPMMDRLGR